MFFVRRVIWDILLYGWMSCVRYLLPSVSLDRAAETFLKRFNLPVSESEIMRCVKVYQRMNDEERESEKSNKHLVSTEEVNHIVKDKVNPKKRLDLDPINPTLFNLKITERPDGSKVFEIEHLNHSQTFMLNKDQIIPEIISRQIIISVVKIINRKIAFSFDPVDIKAAAYFDENFGTEK